MSWSGFLWVFLALREEDEEEEEEEEEAQLLFVWLVENFVFVVLFGAEESTLEGGKEGRLLGGRGRELFCF